eukprot:CAMPEP_0170516666 /NCGR_PEP_ID=MMETSP0209-20121228/2826_1 /TAXON_ID=665100 ORGANISM="Litonotus pictus, Strain P1" /NCGR_SAMPLE_ID=MMETSP0209 /ASSEMBLY_ACC=CAM_ASM_000301 /LENGTH=225 /DNA_ID=CAMNT_0010801635 /DNA_START=1 /DNA_END=678 /DNA_ORIENTATION=-
MKTTSHPLLIILEKIAKIPLLRQKSVSMLAVTKKTNPEKVKELFDLGQRSFGENYVDELIEKSKILTKDIDWHFIGHLQSNKVKKLLQIENLSTIESVDTLNLATIINNHCEKLNRTVGIYLQVNISNETSKSGCKIDEVLKLYSDIMTTCKSIKVVGLMALGTIGKTDEFNLLYDLKTNISKELEVDMDNIGISNGTSSDYEEAIKCGSTQVRLGSVLIKDELI